MPDKVENRLGPLRPSYRSILCDDPSRPLVFIADVLSQPKGDQTLKFDKYIHYQCARALPMAENSDVVVLAGALDADYYGWLRSVGFGPEKVISFNQEQPSALSDLILKHPERILDVVETKSKPLLIPYYCSERDLECAAALGMDILGCPERITLEYFNKVSFKDACKNLGIEMVGGDKLPIDPSKPMNQQEMQEIVESLLNFHGKVLIRGAEDSGTRSFFTVENPEIGHLYNQLVENHDKSVLIEPFMHVISSPNAQWCINNSGEISFIGISTQLFQGFKWAGNLSGQYYSRRVYDYIKTTSQKIVEDMAQRGYIGVIGIDYIVCENGVYPIENNARLTGSTFAIAITDKAKARNNDIECWKFFKAQTDPCTFNELRSTLAPLMYDGTRTNSVFPLMTDLLQKNGTFIALLLAEDMYHIDYMQENLQLLGVTRS